MALIGPFSVGYPVNFTSGGDTTRDAFGKHIQEIERIYGYLNALDAGKVSASDVSGLSGSIGSVNTALTNHINSSNPHPNYKPSVSWSDLTNKPNLADLNGDLPMSRVTGNLDANRINNLPSGGSDKGDGITESTLSGKGYAKFNNGLIIQWGETNRYPTAGDQVFSENFAVSFTDACYVLLSDGPISSGNLSTSISSWTKEAYVVAVRAIASGGIGMANSAAVKYIAIGK